MFNPLVSKSLLKKGIITLSITGALGVSFFIDGKSLLFSKEKAVAISVEEKPYNEVVVKNVIVSESRKIDKPFAYENDHSFEFGPNDSPAFIKIKESDNLVVQGLKNVGKLFVGKEYNLSSKSFYLIGYDMAEIEKDELKFNEENGVLTVEIKELEVVYKPLFELTEVEPFTGLTRIPYTDEQQLEIYNDAIQYGYNLVIDDPLVEKEALEDIEQSIKDRFQDTKGIEGKIKQVHVVFNGKFTKAEENVLQESAKQ